MPSLEDFDFDEVEPGWVEDTAENRERIRDLRNKSNEPGWTWTRDNTEEHFGLIRVFQPGEIDETKTGTGRRDLLVDPKNMWSDFKDWRDLPLDPAAPVWVKVRLVNWRRLEDAGEPLPERDFPARCTHFRADGSRCWFWAAAPSKSTVCSVHMSADQKNGRLGRAQSQGYETLLARHNLKKLANSAVDTMEELLNHAENETVRARMAEAILDRVGIRPGVEIDATVTETSTVDAASQVRDRLSRLVSVRQEEPTDEPPTKQLEIIDAEVVDDDDDS